MLTGLSGRKSIPAASIRGEQTTGIGRVSPLAVRPGEGPLTVPESGHSLGAAGTGLHAPIQTFAFAS